MGPVGLAILLFVGGLVLLVLDIVAPSHFILTLLGIGSLAGGVAALFTVNATAGWISLTAVVIVSPIIIIAGLRLLPRTAVGQLVIPPPPPSNPGSAVPDAGDLRKLVGVQGKAVTTLRPAGICLLRGERVECVAEGNMIEPGETVEVIQVEASKVVVKKA